MWMLLMMVCLLDQNQAAPLPWEQGSRQPVLQQQLDQTTPSDVGQQKTSSSSSSSSSSSVSSESSQSSEGPQQLTERQNLENTAVEQTDSSQESSERPPSPSNSTSLWLSELVLLGARAAERDGERDTGDDSVESRESRHRALASTFHHLLSPPRLGGRGLGVAAGEEGGVRGDEVDAAFPRLLEDGTETADGPTFDSGPAHRRSYHGDEAGLELGL